MNPTRLLVFAAAAAAAFSTAAAQQRITTGTVLVANQQSASATIVDIATQTATTLDVGTGPHEAVISPDGRWGVVTIYGVAGAPGNKLSIIDLPAKKVVRTINLGTYLRPHGASFVTGQPNVVAVTSETTQNVVLADIAKEFAPGLRVRPVQVCLCVPELAISAAFIMLPAIVRVLLAPKKLV